MSDVKDQDPKNYPLEKDNPNLITIFVCFLKSGLRFTRYDTNNVGLAFIDEIKKHNPNFKPTKVQQRERDKTYIVNAYPKEFEQLIMSLIEEYRKKHNLEYRLKKSGGHKGRGGYNRGGGRPGGGGYNQNRDQRGGGNYGRQRRDGQGGYSQGRDNKGGYGQRRDGDGNREGGEGYRPRRNYDDQRGGGYSSGRRGYGNDTRGGGYGNDSRGQSDGGYRPRRDPNQNYNREGFSPNRYSSGDSDENKRPRRPRRNLDD